MSKRRPAEVDDDAEIFCDSDYEEKPKAKKSKKATARKPAADDDDEPPVKRKARNPERVGQFKATRFERAPAAKVEPKANATKQKVPKPPTVFTQIENNWAIDPPHVIFKSDPAAQGGSKIAAMDLDGTLIMRKSIGTQAIINSDDWRWYNAEVPAKLAALRDDGYQLVVFSNQGGIKGATLGVMSAKVRELVDKVLADLRDKAGRDVPMQVLLAPAIESDFRKPGRGMWDYFVANLNAGVAPDLAQSFFVGDAAGRVVDINGGAASDLQFAQAVGLKFKLPEELFGTAAVADGTPCANAANAGMAAAFAELSQLIRTAGGDSAPFKAIALSKVSKVIAEYPEAIKSSSQLKGVPGVGKSSLLKVDEFLQTGTLAALNELKGEAPPAPSDPAAQMAMKFL